MKKTRILMFQIAQSNFLMSKIQIYFKKAGGLKLLKRWVKDGVLLDAVGLFLLLGHTKKALEQLRDAIGLKIQNKLRKKFRKEIAELHQRDAMNNTLGQRSGDGKYDVSIVNFNSVTKKNVDLVVSKTVWIFWWQSIEQAPELVKRCYRSVKKNMTGWNIVLISRNNYKEYTKIPNFILEKLDRGIITITHFSDILRLDLLIRHGGLWLDATVLCTNKNIPETILRSDLFFYQTQKPGADGHATLMSSWCIWSKADNHILKATRSLLYAYWKRYDYMADYFLLHQFMTIVMQEFPEEARCIPPYTNENPHILLLHFFDKYDEHLWNDWKRQTCFHKLSYKLDMKKMKIKDTFYDYIINTDV